MQHARGFIVGCANGWLWSPGRQSTPNSKLGKLFINKNHSISILHTGYKVIGYMFAKQSHWYKLPGFCLNLKQFYWYKRRGLLFKLRRPRAFQLSRRLFTGCILIGWLQVTQWGWGIPPFHRNQNPSPGCLPAPAPAAPHNKTYFSASKTNKKNIRHMNYRHR